jgi:hypothetical protein
MPEQGWIDAAAVALGELQPPHVERKRATIVALVDAQLAGRAEQSVWGLPGVCNRGTYHLKWKAQPDFAAALATVGRLAREWRDTRALRALQEAAENLALAAPAAVMRAIGLMESVEDRVALSAAFGILDRAGIETAAKSSVAETVKYDVAGSLAGLDDDELDALARIAGRLAGAATGTGAAQVPKVAGVLS